MNIYRDLQRVSGLLADVEHYQERIARLQSAAEGLTRQLREGPASTTDRDKMAALVVKLEELQAPLISKIIEHETAIQAAEDFVDLLPENQRKVVRLRYFNRLGWKDVADSMNFSVRQCHRIHDKALQNGGFSA